MSCSFVKLCSKLSLNGQAGGRSFGSGGGDVTTMKMLGGGKNEGSRRGEYSFPCDWILFCSF